MASESLESTDSGFTLSLPDLTPAVARALQAAQESARHDGALAVEPLHLLLGLLEEEQGHAALLLARAHLSATAVKHAFAVHEGAALRPPSTGPLPLHDKTSAILRDARDIATDVSGDSTIASDHLLLALLQRDAAIRDKLVILGLDLAQLETASGRAPTLHLDEP